MDPSRLAADLAAAKVELLSAQCAADRLRLQYSVEDIVNVADRQMLQQAIASAEAVCRFFSHLRTQINPAEQNHRGTP